MARDFGIRIPMIGIFTGIGMVTALIIGALNAMKVAGIGETASGFSSKRSPGAIGRARHVYLSGSLLARRQALAFDKFRRRHSDASASFPDWYLPTSRTRAALIAMRSNRLSQCSG